MAIRYGINYHFGYSSAINIAKVAIAQPRNLKDARYDLIFDADATFVSQMRDMMTRVVNMGGRNQMSVQTAFQWDDGAGLTLAQIQATAYNQAIGIIPTYYDLCNDFELFNEMSLRGGVQTDVPPGTGQSSSAWSTSAAVARAIAAAKGVNNAIHDLAASTGRPLRSILGFVNRDYGFLTYAISQGVNFDVVGWHHYPSDLDWDLETNTWFGTGGIFQQMNTLFPGKPITINEWNTGMEYRSNYENVEGATVTEQGWDYLTRACKQARDTVKCNIESIIWYEWSDQIWRYPDSDSRLGLFFNPGGASNATWGTAKTSLQIATAFAGGALTSTERTALTSRSLLTGAEIDAMASTRSAALSVKEGTGDTASVSVGVKVTGALAVQEATGDTFLSVPPDIVIPVSDPFFRAWLLDPDAIRCTLVEATVRSGGVETTRYMSNLGYVTSGTDAPSNTEYQSCIIDGCETDEEMTIDGTTSLTVGSIVVSNMNGERESWLQDIWKNRPVKMYAGDVRWPRSDFRLVFSGIAKDIAPAGVDALSLELRDKIQQLNTAITDDKIGGTGVNAQRLVPVCLGECHNVEPVLEDAPTQRYRVHASQMERYIETRDNGVVQPGVTGNLPAGTFTLNQAVVGQLTQSVQGDAPNGVYQNTCAKIVQRLATGYGANPFTASDIDAANMAAFDAANPQAMGAYYRDRANVYEECSAFADSLGAKVVMSATGLLRLIRIAIPAAGTPTVVTRTNFVMGSFEPVERIDVRASVKLGYNPCWLVQDNLQSGIPPEHKALYAQPWLTVTATDSVVAGIYKLTDEPIQENTYLLSKATASGEASRRLALWKVQRTIYKYIGFSELMLEELGGAQLITHNRFNMDAGVNAQIIGIRKSWLTYKATIKVLV